MQVTNIPQLLATAWGIPLYAAQGLLTAMLILGFALPPLFASRDRHAISVSLVLGVMGIFISTALGWLDPGLFIVLVLLAVVVIAVGAGKVLGD